MVFIVMNQTNPNILTEDVVRQANQTLTSKYRAEHLLQMAHAANLQMSIELSMRKREWQAVLQDGRDGKEEARFEVITTWGDPSDCMDVLLATIYYNPHTSSGAEHTFCITECLTAIGLAGTCKIESPLFHCETEEQLLNYIHDQETPFKCYLHLEHIMEEMSHSENARVSAYKVRNLQNK